MASANPQMMSEFLVLQEPRRTPAPAHSASLAAPGSARITSTFLDQILLEDLVVSPSFGSFEAK